MELDFGLVAEIMVFSLCLQLICLPFWCLIVYDVEVPCKQELWSAYNSLFCLRHVRCPLLQLIACFKSLYKYKRLDEVPCFIYTIWCSILFLWLEIKAIWNNRLSVEFRRLHEQSPKICSVKDEVEQKSERKVWN